ncbi:uncharacterized protein LOC128253416 [Drosophila gunungcola]|uniref:Uncharacterized protein n=1 Tax=Drosophila gunungcola TaxID=103775 RepID=A0A9P9YK47_9MUSC|nr:uncharacterized protein LOC128253416 [Drosophila gunungcola]KAI8038009.1 hypothetical protein M5D96_009050 [Drosophila gunungcola]
MFDTTKYFPRSIDSDHPSQEEPSEPPLLDIPVTYDMVHNLEGKFLDKSVMEEALEADQDIDTEDKQSIETDFSTTPQLMIIFEEGDINSALHFLIESVHNPFAPNAVAMVLVEEKIREEIVKRIRPKLHPLCESVAEHPNFLAALETLETSNLDCIRADITEVAPPLASPIFVCECTHDVLGDFPTGVITFHTFRNSQEAIDICQRETLPFASVSVWTESLDCCYELAVALSSPTYFLNCTNVDLSPISRQHKAKLNYALIENGFHFETMHIYNQFKCIVFPIGELILPSPEDPKEVPEPTSFLES